MLLPSPIGEGPGVRSNGKAKEDFIIKYLIIVQISFAGKHL